MIENYELTYFQDRVEKEVKEACLNFPSPEALLCALVEEVGEVARACMDESCRRIYDECVQVAAMAARLAIENDPLLTEYRKKKNLLPEEPTVYL